MQEDTINRILTINAFQSSFVKDKVNIAFKIVTCSKTVACKSNYSITACIFNYWDMLVSVYIHVVCMCEHTHEDWDFVNEVSLSVQGVFLNVYLKLIKKCSFVHHR